jgi:hypothetical protein
MSDKVLSRETVQRTLARVRQATDILWQQEIIKPLRPVIDQLTELGDDLLHELQEFDAAALTVAEAEAQTAADGLSDALAGVRDKHAIIAGRD